MPREICVIGGGRWGENHARTLYEMGCLGGIVETRGPRLEELLGRYPAEGFGELEAALERGFDGYVLATPAETHYGLGWRLLEQGQHVLIEKPLALSSRHSGELLQLARRRGCRLMVGHLLLFHPAIIKIKELIDGGKVGQLYYISSSRLNLGTVRTEENVFWSFAPHDISVLEYLVGAEPLAVEAKGSKFLQEKIYDVTMTQFTYPGGVHAHIFVSWLHPFKEQKLVVIGSRGMITFDDSSPEKEILFYNKRIDWVKGQPVRVDEPDEVIEYARKMPLEEELRYFVGCLDGDGTVERACGGTGHRVVQVLEEVQALLEGAQEEEALEAAPLAWEAGEGAER